MDKRLKEIADNFDNMKIGLDDPFKFHCTQCGKCCINREDVLLNPLDLFRAAKELSTTPQDFVTEYCDTYVGETSNIPLVRLQPRGTVKRCPLLKDRKCSIHNAKPTVCAMFPIGRALRLSTENRRMESITTDQIEFIFTNPGCGDKTESHTVREWLTEFNIPLKDEFFIRWQSLVLQLGPEIRKYGSRHDESAMSTLLTLIFIKLYLDYETDKEFLPQFIENAEFLSNLIKHSIS